MRHDALRPVSNVLLLPCRTQLLDWLNSTLAPGLWHGSSATFKTKPCWLPCSTARLAVLHGSSSTWFQTSCYRCAKLTNLFLWFIFGNSRSIVWIKFDVWNQVVLVCAAVELQSSQLSTAVARRLKQALQSVLSNPLAASHHEILGQKVFKERI